MKINKKKLDYLANLSRIKLSQDQQKKFTSHITEILDYVEKIKKVKSKNELYSPSDIFWFRKDEVEDFEKRKLLKNAPEIEEGQIKVKAVFEEKKYDL